MANLSVKFIPGYKLLVTCDTTDIMYVLRHQLTTTGFTTFRNPRTREIVEKPYNLPLYTAVSGDSFEIGAGLIDYLSSFLGQLKKSDPTVHFSIDLPKLSPIPLLDKWLERFKNHPRGYGDYQIADFATLTRGFGGIGELFTGYGKTELLIAIAESYITAFPGNPVVITAPSNSVRDELVARFKKYELDVGIEQWNDPITIVNPAGLIRSGRYDADCKKALSKVKMLLSDECHHLSSASNQTFFEQLLSLERSYGFSASTDSKDGAIPLPGSTTVKDLGESRALIVRVTGGIRIRRRPEIPVHLVKVMTAISERMPDRGEPNSEDSWIALLDKSVVNPKMADTIKMIKDTYSSTRFYVPIHKVESGLVLYENLAKLGVKVAFWNSGTLLPKELMTQATEVDSLKEQFNNGNIDVLISTTVGFEGIDLPSLGGVIPLTGNNHRMVVQPLGRSARGDILRVVLIYDTNNPVLLSQAKKRREKIQEVYKIESDKTFRF